MWVNKILFQTILDDNKKAQDDTIALARQVAGLQTKIVISIEQKAKDDLSIDWMRHRVNALEKQNAVLLGKATGMHFAVPEIVPTRPGTISAPPQFDTMPSFEDVGDDEADRLGLTHDPVGMLTYNGKDK